MTTTIPEVPVKLLLTSAGVKNAEHPQRAGRPAGQADRRLQRALHPHGAVRTPQVGRGRAWRFISGQGSSCPWSSWGGSPWACWSSPRCPASTRTAGSRGPGGRRAAGRGGDALYLCHWMRESGLVDLLPSLTRDGLGGAERREHGDDPRIGEDFVGWKPPTGGDETLGSSTSRSARTWPRRHARQHDGRGGDVGRRHHGPAYAIDDDTAIRVVDGTVDVVSEGHWRLLPA